MLFLRRRRVRVREPRSNEQKRGDRKELRGCQNDEADLSDGGMRIRPDLGEKREEGGRASGKGKKRV